MARWLYALAVAAALSSAGWVGLELCAFPEPPARPADTGGYGFRIERGSQHVLHVSGSPYALGFYDARSFPELMRRQEEALLDALFTFTGGPIRAVLVSQLSLLYLAGLDRYLAPAERQEILGLAEGAPDPFPDLGPRYARLAAYHALHELSQRIAFDNPLTACSLIAVSARRGAEGHTFLARNFDFEAGEVFDRDKVVRAVKPAHGLGFVSVAWAGMAGVVSGINERGLAIVINAGASSDYNRVGAPTSLLVRRALEQASTVGEAVLVLTSAPRFVTDIIGLADATGRIMVLELTPNHVAWREGDVLVATNHLESEALADDRTNIKRQGETTTVPRRRRLGALVAAHPGPYGALDLLAILRDKRAADGSALPLGHRQAIDAYVATHSVIFDATAGLVWVSAGPQTAGPYYGYDVQKLIAALTPRDAQAAFVSDLPADTDPDRAWLVAQARFFWQQAAAALQRDDLARAEQALAEVPDLLGGHPTTLRLEGDLALAEGDRERAATLWRRALAIPPESPREAQELARDLTRLTAGASDRSLGTRR
jgi:isopenicillin-N N-acyltransferase-like protein